MTGLSGWLEWLSCTRSGIRCDICGGMHLLSQIASCAHESQTSRVGTVPGARWASSDAFILPVTNMLEFHVEPSCMRSVMMVVALWKGWYKIRLPQTRSRATV
jgi:hypothetical protein